MTKRMLQRIGILLLNICIFLSIISAASVGMNVYADGQNIRVEFFNGNTGENIDAMYINFRVRNLGSSGVDLSSIKFRYYFNDDGVSPITVSVDNAHNNYSNINSSITWSIIQVNSPDANKYIELGYNKAAGTLAPNNFSEIKVRVYHPNYNPKFNQKNDYSFCSTNTDYAQWDKVTAYLDGVKVFGTEPVILSSVPSASVEPTIPVVPTPTFASTSTPVSTPTEAPLPTYVPTPVQAPRPNVPMPANQIVKNGNFTDGSKNWVFKSTSISGADASNAVVNDGYGDMWSVTNIKNVGSDYWSIQLMQDGLELKSATTYRVSFDAKASVKRDIRVAIRNQTTYTEYFSKTQSIDTNMKTYTYEFTMKSSYDQIATIVFSMGKFGESPNNSHDIYIDNVIIEKITLPPPSPSPTNDGVNKGIKLSRNSIKEAELGASTDITIYHEGELIVDGKINKENEIVLVIDNSGILNTYQEDVWTPLDFGIYSNHDLILQGQGAVVNGSTHANNLFRSTAFSVKIDGISTACTFEIISQYFEVKELINITMPVEMPYFHSQLINEAAANMQVYKPEDFLFPINRRPMPGQTDIFIEYNWFYQRFEITGGGTLVINSSMYFMSNLFISLNNTNNVNEGFLIADGNITIQGKDIYPTGPNDRLYVYSINGNIEFQTSNSTINGIVYAPGNPSVPNSGNIYFSGNNNTINGTIAGSNLNFSAAGLTVNHMQGQFDSIEKKYIESVTYLKSVKDVAKALVDLYAGTKTKIAVIQYSDSANKNDFKLFNMSSEKEVNDLKKKINDIAPGTSGDSNLGDGMRRAYHILNKSPGKKAEKYIVVLAGSVPNKWTSTSNVTLKPKTDDGNAQHIKSDEVLYKSLDYAKDIGSIISGSKIRPFFIDFSPNDIDAVLETIAVASGAEEVTNTGKHFYSGKNKIDLYNIFEQINLETVYDVSLNDAVYEEIFPVGVKVLEVPEWMEIQTVVVDGMTRDKVSGNIDIVPLSFDGEKYNFSIDSFIIKVQFLKPGDILFEGKDAKLKFKLEYIDADNKTVSKDIEAYPENMTVKVTMKVDIT
ncbi:MAG TPA: carbohydrate binding domain-containing protein [Acetivibrio sp.]|nr:carbohydrate binding domain-containing protein [Acetivibrio sp.]